MTCLFPGLPKSPPGIPQPQILVEAISLLSYLILNYLGAFHIPQGQALQLLHPSVSDSPHESKRWLGKGTGSEWRPGLHHHCQTVKWSLKEHHLWGVHIGVFQYKSFTLDGCRFGLFSTLSKLLHRYASFKTQKHQFIFFLCLSLSVSTSWKSNSSLFIKSTISLWTERQGKPFPE